MTDHANELRRHARKIPRPQGETPGVMLRAADEIECLRIENEALRAKVEQMERQEPIGGMLEISPHNYELRWYRPVPFGAKLYTLPGAQPAPSVPEGWIQRGMAELEAIRSRQDDDTLLDDRTLIERIGKAMLAAAPEAKP